MAEFRAMTGDAMTPIGGGDDAGGKGKAPAGFQSMSTEPAKFEGGDGEERAKPKSQSNEGKPKGESKTGSKGGKGSKSAQEEDRGDNPVDKE
jgi:hypothetical protein